MKREFKDGLNLVACISICFFIWVGMLGVLYDDGFLDLDAVSNETKTLPRLNFDCVCVLPPISFGMCLFGYITAKINKRVKNEDKNKD